MKMTNQMKKYLIYEINEEHTVNSRILINHIALEIKHRLQNNSACIQTISVTSKHFCNIPSLLISLASPNSALLGSLD